jgi:hypothetical protein
MGIIDNESGHKEIFRIEGQQFGIFKKKNTLVTLKIKAIKTFQQ